jgi:hypothetical protein
VAGGSSDNTGTAERHASMPCCATKPVVEGDVPEHAVTVQRKDALLEHAAYSVGWWLMAGAGLF